MPRKVPLHNSLQASGMSWPKPMPIVEVEWLDAGGVSRSTGYLYRDDPQGLVLMAPDAIAIPQCAVKSCRVLCHGKAREWRSA